MRSSGRGDQGFRPTCTGDLISAFVSVFFVLLGLDRKGVLFLCFLSLCFPGEDLVSAFCFAANE